MKSHGVQAADVMSTEVISVTPDTPLADVAHINVFVKDGVVELWGSVDSEEEAHAMRIAASTIPGVRAVDDHLAMLPAWAWAD